MAAEPEEAVGDQAHGRAGGAREHSRAGGAREHSRAGGAQEHSRAEGTPGGSAFLHVQTTTDSRAEAMELAHDAVQARLAACAQVAGPLASTFWWEDGIERAEEWLLMLKLPVDRYTELAEFLLDRHSYDEPEIIATPIIAGSAGYLDWIDEETRPH